MIIVISGPSGVGKGTVVQKLIEKNPHFVRSISCTTRKPREGEKNGRDYHFINEDKFFELIQKNDLAEFAFVHGYHYGTPLKNLTKEKTDVILQIDVQGAKKIKNRFPEALLIFLLPPSMEILTNRLTGRGTETEEEQERRLKRAKEEIKERTFYDYIVVNDDIKRVVSKIEKIIEKEHKLHQQNKTTSSQ
ncbi:MAG: guanylate kinase [Caldisericaceae bacterium]|nr:guanylate kinase [Caldisericaceae bacterium]RLD20740.1 MAG: guanylate kinase [Caldisericota bacterium]